MAIPPCLAVSPSQARFPHRTDCFTEGLVLNGSEAWKGVQGVQGVQGVHCKELT